MNSRGQLGDFATFIVMLFVCGLVFLIVWFVMGTINSRFSSDPNIPADIDAKNLATFGDYGDIFDNMFFMLFVGVLLAGLILSYVLQSNPGMFFVLLMVVFLMSIVAGYLGNAYTTVSQDPLLSGAAASLPITGFIMDNYLLMTFIVITLMNIVFFAKPNSGAGAF